ncbi:DUF6414 family protein [Rhodoglobus aureus]|uniref:Uncharacterized protein n=1 Tax=Rhodoglobus aureus TaxID=191497 RepID=A0ABP4G8K5_9MICO
MLRNFLYLNESTLNGYLSALEDGLRSVGEHRTTQSKSLLGKAGLGGFGTQGETESDTELSHSYSDTSEARFERFISLCAANPERSGWVDIINSDDDFAAASPGTILEFDCEIFVPPMIRSLTSSGGIGEAMAMMKSLSPLMTAVQPSAQRLPPDEQIQALTAMSSVMGDDLAIVGERDDTDWRVAGRLIAASIRDSELDGVARVVGKVSAAVRAGEHKSLLALPGMNLMTREQRRAQAKLGPKPGEEANWLSGPAVMLDVLAVYR